MATDLTNERYGFLTVVSLASEPTAKAAEQIWNCNCVCGKPIQKPRGELINARNRGAKICCGCKRKERIKAASEAFDRYESFVSKKTAIKKAYYFRPPKKQRLTEEEQALVDQLVKKTS